VPPTEPTVRNRRRGRGSAQRLDENVACDSTADGHLHPMNVDEERPVERAAAGHADGITRVKAEVVQSLAEAAPAADIDHARVVAGRQLVEGHS